MHISLAAEPLFHLGSFPVTNSLIASISATALLSITALSVYPKLKATPNRLQNLLETIMEGGLGLAESIGGHYSRQFFPLVITFFLFILISNWMGLLPGFGSLVIHKIEEGHEVTIPLLRGATADLNTTLALALISVVAMQYFGFRNLKLSYLKRFFNKNPLYQFIGILEIITDLSKILSFAFRLFGNIFAGEVLLVVISSLIFLIAPLPFFGLEVFVGAIQALVFAMLSLVFFNIAVSAHESEH
jgi:F-type H+-transporting ATPase subunit a